MMALRLLLFSFAAPVSTAEKAVDSRNVLAGNPIGTMTTGYADQPMVLVRKDGTWLCSATHNPSHEGGAGEAVYTTTSKDQGKTWSATLPLETQGKEQYAYSTLFQSNLPSGRIYVVYVQNFQNITKDPATGKKLPREDMMGGFFLKYSDDGGLTWSQDKWEVPVRKTYIDEHNEWNGTVRLEWLVDKGFQHGDAAYLAFTKIGLYMVGPPTSGWLLYSPNLGSAETPDDIQWKTLPEDNKGIRSYNDSMVAAGCGLAGVGSNGCFTSESHVVPLDKQSSLELTLMDAAVQHLYVVFRTSNGFMGAQVSHDGGKSFGDLPVDDQGNHRPWALHRREPGSPVLIPRPLKQPRGPMTPRRLPTTKSGAADFLMLYYNDGWTDVAPHLGVWTHRNPYWLVPGWIDVTRNHSGSSIPQGVLWGEPEVGLYVPGIYEGVGSGYPDFIVNTNTDGTMEVWITETQKSVARVHRLDDDLLQALLQQNSLKNLVPPAISFSGADVSEGKNVTVPVWPKLTEPSSTSSPPASMYPRQGFAVTMWFSGLGAASNIAKFKLLESDGVSIEEVTLPNGKPSLQLYLQDSVNNVNITFTVDEQCSAWLSGPNPSTGSTRHFVAFSVDAGSRVISAVVDGVFCDGGPQSWGLHPSGGDTKAFNGWQFLPRGLTDVGGSGVAYVGAFRGKMSIYGRYLLTGEMIASWRAGEGIGEQSESSAVYV